MMLQETILEAYRGDDNIWEFDISTAIDQTNDEIRFTAKEGHATDDADATLQYALNVSPLTGVAVTNEATGVFTVTSPVADLQGVTDRALIYDVVFYDDSATRSITVAKGIIRIVGEVTEGG